MSESKDNQPAPKQETDVETGSSKTPAEKHTPQRPEPAQPARPLPEKKSQTISDSGVLWLALLSLAASIALAVAAFFFWNQQQQIIQTQSTVADRVDNKLQEVDVTISRVKTGFDNLKSSDEKNRTVLSGRFEQLTESQRAQTSRIEALSAVVGRSSKDWILAEVEFLLRVANERVHLQRDVKTALVALENADQHLLELADPGLAQVREQIASERDQLQRVPVIDREGMAVIISTLLKRLDSLPINGQVYKAHAAKQIDAAASVVTETESPENFDLKSWQDWKKVPQIIGDALRKLVTIREHDKAVQPMMQPDSEAFLRQNLRLQIEAARLALLREDAVFYEQTLDTAKGWIEEYFSLENGDVQATLEQLNELASVQIHPTMPDISKSLRILRKQVEASARSAGTLSEDVRQSEQETKPDPGNEAGQKP